MQEERTTFISVNRLQMQVKCRAVQKRNGIVRKIKVEDRVVPVIPEANPEPQCCCKGQHQNRQVNADGIPVLTSGQQQQTDKEALRGNDQKEKGPKLELHGQIEQKTTTYLEQLKKVNHLNAEKARRFRRASNRHKVEKMKAGS